VHEKLSDKENKNGTQASGPKGKPRQAILFNRNMKDFVNNLFTATDRMDADAFVLFLTENASFRFANAPAVFGRENIRKAVSDFFSSVKSLQHRILGVWEDAGTVICEGEVTYERHDGGKSTFSFVDILRMKGQLIVDYRVYIDISGLYI